MFKSPKNKGFLEQQKILVKNYSNMFSIVDSYTYVITDKIFDVINNSIQNKIILASKNSLLRNNDENIYEYCSKIISNYKEIVEIYENNKNVIVSHDKINILEGICSILQSQIKQFNDFSKDTEENPIFLEKENIVNNAIKDFLDEIKKYELFYVKSNDNTLINETLLNADFSKEKLFEAIILIITKLKQDLFSDIYNIYVDIGKKCILNMNNLENRTCTNEYILMLKQEQENLSTIIKIQVSALAEEINSNDQVQEEEKLAISIILELLKNCYEYAEKKDNDISNILKDLIVIPEANIFESFEDFSNELSNDLYKELDSEEVLDILKYDVAIKEYLLKYKKFAKVLTHCIETNITKSGYLEGIKKMYTYKKIISEQFFISDEIKNAFNIIIKYFNTKKNDVEYGESLEIIKGVIETVQIKIESIQENKADFYEESSQLLKHLSEENQAVSLDISKIVDEAIYIWKPLYFTTDKKTILENTLNEVYNLDIITTYLAKVEKNQNTKDQKVAKCIFKYKRDNILYEISTYEEIKHYSISKLEQSDNEYVKEFVEIFNSVSKMIETILKKHNISLIKPMPGEVFNGKEHEVLMAEKNEEYLKGQIIKVMNSGYKQNGVVIIRANVIAAK